MSWPMSWSMTIAIIMLGLDMADRLNRIRVERRWHTRRSVTIAGVVVVFVWFVTLAALLVREGLR